MDTFNVEGYGVNKYNQSPNINSTSSASKAGTPYSPNQNGIASLQTQDFLQLLASQLANQDVMNPMDDTQFVSQLAQFTSLQAMDSLTKIATTQYGASLVGKTAIVASYDAAGKYTEDTGTISNVKYASGTPVIQVNGKEYPLSALMEVVNGTGEITYKSSVGGAIINFGTMAKQFPDYEMKIQFKTDADNQAKTVGVTADTGKKQICITLDATDNKKPTKLDLQTVLQGEWKWQTTNSEGIVPANLPDKFDSKAITVSGADNDTTKYDLVSEASTGWINAIR